MFEQIRLESFSRKRHKEHTNFREISKNADHPDKAKRFYIHDNFVSRPQTALCGIFQFEERITQRFILFST